MVSHSLPLPGRPAGSAESCGGISLISPESGGGYVGQGAAILFTCGPGTIQDRGLACCHHAGLLLRRLRCWSQPRFPFSCSQPQPPRRKAGRAPARSRTSRSWPRRLRRGRARPCASSSPRKSRSTANCRWSRPTEALPPNRASGSAGRLISGSPKSMRLPPGNGGRTSLRQTAAMLPAKSPCAPISRRGRRLRREASGRCATPGIAAWRTCSRPGSRNCLTRRSTPRRHGRRCMKCCATSRATSCSTISASAKTR